MIKSEVMEIRKQLSHDNCGITKICGCYVDGEKNIKTRLSENFLCLPEEETFKYFEIFKKTLSGTLGKNLLNVTFPLEEEFSGGTQEFLLKLRDSGLKDEALMEEFYQMIIRSYDYIGNYLILIVHGAYDVPGKTKDKRFMEDASDEVYNFVLFDVCPVNLSKPGISYNAEENQFKKRSQEWVVELPLNGFLFPAFNDRSSDIHSLLYYSKNSEELHSDFVKNLLGCETPLSAGNQKESFREMIEEVLGEECEYQVVRSIHENIKDMIEENSDVPEPVFLYKEEVASLFRESGVKEEKLQDFEKYFEAKLGKDTSFVAENVVNKKVFEVKTNEAQVKIQPEYAGIVETRMIDGKKCLVIPLDEHVEINGISVKVTL